MLEDVTASKNINCSQDTFDDYVTALEKLFVIQDIDAWCPAIRSKTAIRSTPKRGFCDPSIAVSALGLTPDALNVQLKTFGFIFEQMCIRDLKAYTIDMNSHVSYYRDRYGLEADVVLHLPDGRYAIIECKLGSMEIEKGAEHLLKIRDLIREKNKTEKQMPIREPDLMIILTGGQMAYTRNDGVKVIPLATLRRDVMTVKDKIVSIFYRMKNLSVRRFWRNIGRWFSYFNVCRNVEDWDYTSILTVERHQIERVRDSIAHYHNHFNADRDIERLNLALCLLDIIEEDGCCERIGKPLNFVECKDKEGLYELEDDPESYYTIPVYVNHRNAVRYSQRDMSCYTESKTGAMW